MGEQKVSKCYIENNDQTFQQIGNKIGCFTFS